MTILILDKLYFRAKKITRDREERHSNKFQQSMERHSNPKSICTKQQRCKIYEAKLIELQGGKDKSTSIVGDVNNS